VEEEDLFRPIVDDDSASEYRAVPQPRLSLPSQ
jgi:hypothetical protein